MRFSANFMITLDRMAVGRFENTLRWDRMGPGRFSVQNVK